MEAAPFDVFIRSYDDRRPLITLTVSGQTTIGKLKQLFSESCKHYKVSMCRLGDLLPRQAAVLAWRSPA